MTKRNHLQQTLSFLLLFLTLGVVLYIGLNGNDLRSLAHALQKISPKYLLLCLVGWLVYVLTDALSIHYYLRLQNVPIRLWQSIHSAVVGIYYCNVTPGASGGQPMQMYCLSKYGVPVGMSGSGVAVKFIVFQVVLLVTGAVLWPIHGAFVSEYAGNSRWFVLLGYVVNFFSIGMVTLTVISQKAIRWIVERCIRIGVRLRLCKDPEASRAKWENHCQGFLESFQQLMRHPLKAALLCLIALAQLVALMVVVIAVYHALGLQGISNSELLTMGVLLYIAASYTPLPGASGAQEGGFAVMFSGIFPGANCFVALMIWRFFTYYLSILVGAVVATVENISVIRQERRKPQN